MNLKWDAPVKALEMWKPEIKASAKTENTIDIYDVIGEGYFETGMTASFVTDVLNSAGGEAVTVNINSPGGDMFEGLAIYNLLSAYQGDVSVRVMGMAASAASIIAMAGDNIEIADSAFFMIHNGWSLVIGNKNDFKKASEDFEKFDTSMAGIYSARSGKELEEIHTMMDEETWISGKDSVAMGFANSLLGSSDVTEDEDAPNAKALRKIDTALAKTGMARSERRGLLKELTNTPSAVEDATPCASDEEVKRELKALLDKLNSH